MQQELYTHCCCVLRGHILAVMLAHLHDTRDCSVGHISSSSLLPSSLWFIQIVFQYCFGNLQNWPCWKLLNSGMKTCQHSLALFDFKYARVTNSIPASSCEKALEFFSAWLAMEWINCILFHTIGIFIRRHRIALPAPNDDQCYTVHDFNIGIDITFYGRTFKIYDCDEFTKNFLKKIGIKLNPPKKCPYDPYTKMRREVSAMAMRRTPSEMQ